MTSDSFKAKKILILGNSCGGKTYLSRLLAQKTGLPRYHVDSIQFNEQLQIKDHKETNSTLNEITQKDEWILDGFGPLDQLFPRMDRAELIIFIDLPLWQHYAWAILRIFKNLFVKKRRELPAGSDERSVLHNYKLLENIWKVHQKMRPEMLRILQKQSYKEKVLIQKSLDMDKIPL